ncbi:TPA: hypothetical protein ACN18G_005194 [Escherichia coli]|nr:hypothetical protein [Escherichia coli]EHM3366432.1 hypothetical protein [Escherichia coli]EHN3966483.1 hypothetical protein [Escherichia coli]EHN3966898.1 hypothetical protein [Escherichia coli]EIC1530433.1 hypothetical protein [Escherichia coli]EIC1530831.1 hypothetical protein [Escherichia coli]
MTKSSQQDLAQVIHDVRKPLNRISMQAELIKLVLENDLALILTFSFSLSAVYLFSVILLSISMNLF